MTTPRPDQTRRARAYAAATADLDDALCVRRQPLDTRVVEVKVADLRRPHWSDVSGGVGRRAPRQFVHGYISCDLIPDDADFGHSCLHGPPPHDIKVCVVAKDNSRSVMTRLKERADMDRAARGSRL